MNLADKAVVVLNFLAENKKLLKTPWGKQLLQRCQKIAAESGKFDSDTYQRAEKEIFDAKSRNPNKAILEIYEARNHDRDASNSNRS